MSASAKLRSAVAAAAVALLAAPAAPVPAGAAEGMEVADPIIGFTFAVGTPALYTPSEALRIKAGTTVVWTNLDPVGHDVSFEDGEMAPYLETGESAQRTFTKPGRYPFHCHTHHDVPLMHGLVYVE